MPVTPPQPTDYWIWAIEADLSSAPCGSEEHPHKLRHTGNETYGLCIDCGQALKVT